MGIQRFMAQITLPETDNDGQSLVGVHAALKNGLLANFGGYTSVAATGAWIDDGKIYEEDVIVYNVAMDKLDRTMVRFENLAKTIAKLAGQVAVAITLPTGEFKLIYPANVAVVEPEPSPTYRAMDWYYGQDDGGSSDA